MFDADETNIRYIYLAYGLLCLALLVRSGGFSLCEETSYVLAYIIFSAVSLLWAQDRGNSLVRLRGEILLFVLLVLMTSYFFRHESTYVLVFAVILGSIALSGYMFYLYGINGVINAIYQGNERLGWDINNVNAIGNSLALGIVAIVGCAVFYKKRLPLLLLIPIGICFLAAGSRTATISVVVGVLAAMYCYTKVTAKASAWISTVIVAIIIISVLWSVVRNIPATRELILRLENAFAVFTGGEKILKENSAQTRLDYIELGWEQFLKSPLFGNGIGNAGYAMVEKYGYTTYLHNNYMEMLASGGIIGFLLFYAPYFILFGVFRRRLFREHESNPLLCVSFVLLITKLVAHMGTVVYYSKIEFLLLALWVSTANMERIQGNQDDIMQ